MLNVYIVEAIQERNARNVNKMAAETPPNIHFWTGLAKIPFKRFLNICRIFKKCCLMRAENQNLTMIPDNVDGVILTYISLTLWALSNLTTLICRHFLNPKSVTKGGRYIGKNVLHGTILIIGATFCFSQNEIWQKLRNLAKPIGKWVFGHDF